MRMIRNVFALMLALSLAACATTARQANNEASAKVPEPAKGEVAVVGKVRLIEFVAKVPLPAEEQDGTIYLKSDSEDKTYKVRCSDTGDFGVYLPSGTYKVSLVKVAGYKFAPDSLTLAVPKEYKVSYSGTLVMDGSPSGVVAGTGKTVFVYSVKDEYPEFASAFKEKAATYEGQIVKSLFHAGDSRATGSYPSKVMRPKDISSGMAARSDEAEKLVGGVIVSLPYVINPIWIFTLP